MRGAHSPTTFAIFCPSRIIFNSVLRVRFLIESYQPVSVWKISICAMIRSRTCEGVSESFSRAVAHSRRKVRVGSISRRLRPWNLASGHTGDLAVSVEGGDAVFHLAL